MPRQRDGRHALVLLLLLVLATILSAQVPVANGTIHGQILDLQSGEPIANVSVSIEGQSRTTNTDRDGRFTLLVVPAGSVDLRVSTVGYGLLKRHLDLTPGQDLPLDLRLGQQAVRDTQQITVVAAPFDPIVADAPTQYSLSNAELQDLSTVLANDPFRAIANLPGVSAGVDFYADFAVRGAGSAHVGVYVDGVLVDHPSYAFEDSGDLGSLSVVSGDMVRSLSLLSGAFPASFGNRTGSILDIATRDGARDRIATRFTADALGVALTSEGPIGRSHKAAWLVSARQSYLAYLLARMNLANGLTLNYHDITGKVSYDANPHHHFNLSSTLGASTAARSPNNTAGQAPSAFTSGGFQHGMTAAHWDYIRSPRTLIQTHGYWTYDHEHDTNAAGAVDLDTTSNVYGVRTDLTHQAGRWNKLQAGLESRSAQQQRNSFQQWNYVTQILSPSLLPLDQYARTAWQPAGYLEDTATLFGGNVTLLAGTRWQHNSAISQSLFLPHASAIVKAARGLSLTLAYGQYGQPPSLQQLYGAFGTPTLRAERATHETFAIDQFLNERVRLHVELYNRQESDDIDASQIEFRLLPNGQVGFPTLGAVRVNSLHAYARGVEFSLQRRSANRLSGWITYARSYSKYWQPGTAFSYQGDYDQRNTFSAYAAYRITHTIDVSSNVRYGSGTPIPGYLAPSSYTPPPNTNATLYFPLSQTRNTIRTEDYLRTDLRASKVFNRKHFNLTLHGEIENLTGRPNYSYYNFHYPYNVARSPYAIVRRQTTLPFLPVAGLTLEF